MSRSTLTLALVLALTVMVALTGCVAETPRTRPEPPAMSAARAPIDAAVPRQLSTATFGLG